VQPSGPGIREDCGIYEGWTVPMDFDPLLSKLIAYAPARDAAIARMRMALNQYVIGGIRSNLRLFERILSDPAFVRAELDTGYLDRFLAQERQTSAGQEEQADPISSGDRVAAAAALYEAGWGARAAALHSTSPGCEPRAESRGWKRRAREEGLGSF
jgi:acetyl-CoA carboxylase, biotin carboxylase subunit